MAAIWAVVGVVAGIGATLAAGPVASAWDQRNNPTGSIELLDRSPVTTAVTGNIHKLAVREDAHGHPGTYFLVIHPVGEGANGELYPRRLPQPADTVSTCKGASGLLCTPVNLGEQGNHPSKFRLTLYFVTDDNFGRFEDVAATFEPFTGKELPSPATAVDTVTVTRSS
ncbi:hypothetical protein ACWGJ9_09280 [Curtobacterium citreum]